MRLVDDAANAVHPESLQDEPSAAELDAIPDMLIADIVLYAAEYGRVAVQVVDPDVAFSLYHKSTMYCSVEWNLCFKRVSVLLPHTTVVPAISFDDTWPIPTSIKSPAETDIDPGVTIVDAEVSTFVYDAETHVAPPPSEVFEHCAQSPTQANIRIASLTSPSAE